MRPMRLDTQHSSHAAGRQRSKLGRTSITFTGMCLPDEASKDERADIRGCCLPSPAKAEKKSSSHPPRCWMAIAASI